MERFRPKFFILLVAGFLAAGDALAHRGPSHRHARVGVVIGVPLTAPWTYPDYYYPYTYSSPPVVVLPSPPVYIEQNTVPQMNRQPEGYWWYYCPGARTYYPYVTECPQGWQLVPPHPPDLR